MLFVFLAPLASAEVQINLNSVYNAGEIIPFTFSTASTQDEITNLQIELQCGNSTQLLFFRTIALEKDDIFSLEDSLPLPQKEGRCYLEFSLGASTQKTNSFDLSKNLRVNLDVLTKEINPGDAVEIEGIISNIRGEEISPVYILIDGHEIKNNKGEFNTKITTVDSIKSGFNTLNIRASDKFENSIEDKLYFTIIPSPTELELIINEYNLLPENRVQVNAYLYDQAGDLIEVLLPLTIENEEGEVVQGNNAIDFKLSQYAIPGEWIVKTEYLDFNEELIFTVEENLNLSIEIQDNEVIIENVGNIPYNDILAFKINDQDIERKVKLNPGELTKINLWNELKDDLGRLTIYYGDSLLEFENIVIDDPRSTFNKLGDSITGNAVVSSASTTSFKAVIVILAIAALLLFAYKKLRKIKKRSHNDFKSEKERKKAQEFVKQVKDKRSSPTPKKTFGSPRPVSPEEASEFRESVLGKKDEEENKSSWNMFN